MKKIRDEAIELIEFLKKQEQYAQPDKLRAILRYAADMLYKAEKEQIKMDI